MIFRMWLFLCCAPWERRGRPRPGRNPNLLFLLQQKNTGVIQVDGIRLIEEVTPRLVHPIADEVDPVLLLGI